MAFGVTREELAEWKKQARNGHVSFLTHFWYDPRFPEYKTVTKAACSDRDKLIKWGEAYGLKEEWIHDRDHFPHFDLIGKWERKILKQENSLTKLDMLEKKMRSGRMERSRNSRERMDV